MPIDYSIEKVSLIRAILLIIMRGPLLIQQLIAR